MNAAVFGLIVADLIASPFDLRSPPPPGGLTTLRHIQLTTGGNVPNVAIAMAKLGMRAAAAGMVGRDALGAALLDRLRESGVDVACAFASDRAQTSSTLVAVEPGGERCFFHVPGATMLLDASFFRRCVPMFAQCEVVHIGYIGLLPPALTAELPQLIAELRAASPGTKVALDTVNPPGSWSELAPILPHVDYFCPSRAEGAALTREVDPHAMIDWFRERAKPQALIGIKLDADGCVVDDGRERVSCPAYAIEVVDTTGAGDTWFAALLVALHREMPPETAARFANRAAADCCTMLGASAGVRSFEETLSRV